MTAPTQTCQVCGDVEIVRMDGRGFPPKIAANRLAKRCAAKGHTSEPQYLVGLASGAQAMGMLASQPLPEKTPTKENR